MSRSRILRDQRRQRRQTVRALFAPKLLSAPLMEVFKHARWMFEQVCAFFDVPREIALRTYMHRDTHKTFNDLVYHLELIVRRMLLVAALALDIVLTPLKPGPRASRKPRRRLIWPHRPETWRVAFRLFNVRARGEVSLFGDAEPTQRSRFLTTMPLARRFEAVRRVLTNPDRFVRRAAFRLARLHARSTPEAPRYLRLRKLNLDFGPHVTRGLRMIMTPLATLSPLAADAVARWNAAAEPD